MHPLTQLPLVYAPGLSLNDRLAREFRMYPMAWLDGRVLAQIAGAYAWRSRVSDLRKRGMVIENRQRHLKDANGRKYTVSEYRYVPPTA